MAKKRRAGVDFAALVRDGRCVDVSDRNEIRTTKELKMSG